MYAVQLDARTKYVSNQEFEERVATAVRWRGIGTSYNGNAVTPGERRRVEIGRSYKARKTGAVIRWHPKFCSAVPGEIPTPLNIRRHNRRGQAGLAKSQSSGYKTNGPGLTLVS